MGGKTERQLLLLDGKINFASNIRALLEDNEQNREVDKEAVFDETATGRRRQHLIRLNRLATLLDRLPRTNMETIREYESSLEDYEIFLKDPGDLTPEEIGDRPELPELPDIKAAYYELFPECNERTRQRDFEMLNDIGSEVDIGTYDVLSVYDPGDLRKTADGFDRILRSYLHEYEKAGLRPARYADADAFAAAYMENCTE